MTATQPGYLDTLLKYYEEEIMGEIYFYGLSRNYDDAAQQEKLSLMAEVERYAAEAVRPVLQKYNITPRSDAELKPFGEAWIEKKGSINWNEFVTDMTVRYPEYIEQLKALEAMAPEDDVQTLRILTNHEVALVAFAKREVAGRLDSLEPIHNYLSQT